MYSNYTQLFIHLVWATWNRLPLITDDVQTELYSAIAAKCIAIRCQPLAIGGIADHVHTLIRMPTTISVAEIAKDIKGSSSHLMTHNILPETAFKWQGSYGAFSVSKSGVERVIAYIHNQKVHHESQHLISELELCHEP
ncbi:MAG TPA: IS200/IS605 family transposase [Anaerolineae bacterium]|jgi:REP element-mobilizing transposase RayT